MFVVRTAFLLALVYVSIVQGWQVRGETKTWTVKNKVEDLPEPTITVLNVTKVNPPPNNVEKVEKREVAPQESSKPSIVETPKSEFIAHGANDLDVSDESSESEEVKDCKEEKRCKVHKLPKPEDLVVADAEESSDDSNTEAVPQELLGDLDLDESDLEGSGFRGDYDYGRHKSEMISSGIEHLIFLTQSATSTLTMVVSQIAIGFLEAICKTHKMMCIFVASSFKTMVENNPILKKLMDVIIGLLPTELFVTIAASDILPMINH